MKQTQKILVYDNDEDFLKYWVGDIKSLDIGTHSYQADLMDEDTFETTIKTLLQRQGDSREGKSIDSFKLDIDKAAFFFIDYDLFDIEKEFFLTGENVAYLTRCFSNCGIIVGINQGLRKTGTNPFDLSLKGRLDSYCDLNIGEDQIKNKGLWFDHFEDFRPWYWPLVPHHYENFLKQIEEISDPDKKISDTLNISEIVPILPNVVRQFLGGDPGKATFREFVLNSGNGLRGRDTWVQDSLLARIAAARISKWLERIILQGQNYVVDAPHLVSRFPSLLLGDQTEESSWNKTTSFELSEIEIKKEIIDEHRYSKSHWFSRPVWFWDKISTDTRITEVANPWDREVPKFAFCEDSSRFRVKEDCRKFTIESKSPYITRFLNGTPFEGVIYQPAIRLLHE